MLKVVLIDDEPFIIEGLKLIIDWKKEGFEIVKTLSNGKEALEYIKHNPVDLILSDIKMPVMGGLELLKTIRTEQLSDAFFVILSGYSEFAYAQQAIMYQCTNYLLKPIDYNEMVNVLNEVKKMHHIKLQDFNKNEKMERAFLERNLLSLISGKYNEIEIENLKSTINCSDPCRYIEFQFTDDFTDENQRNNQRELYNLCRGYLGNYSKYCILDAAPHEIFYEVGFIYFNEMAKEYNKKESDFFVALHNYLTEKLHKKITMLIGKEVKNIKMISISYGNVQLLRSVQYFRPLKNILYYENELQISSSKVILCKEEVDAIIKAIEDNDKIQIKKAIGSFYDIMGKKELSEEVISLNINYMIFQLINIATEQDSNINQEDILHNISEQSLKTGYLRGSSKHLEKFAKNYAEYLLQLRQDNSHKILYNVKMEIENNYSSNITLKGLSEKYYINSAYLGQIFHKKFQQSFKDYLNDYRIEKATTLLTRTDKKIQIIAQEVGYNEVDYFVSKFITKVGCTPSRYRKEHQ